MKRDVQATAEKKFKDSRSYVAKDGRHVLYGSDWTDRKFALLLRSGGRCERLVGSDQSFERCRSSAADPHHKIPRSKGRDDRLSNLEALCRLHHDLMDTRKVRSDRKEHRDASA